MNKNKNSSNSKSQRNHQNMHHNNKKRRRGKKSKNNNHINQHQHQNNHMNHNNNMNNSNNMHTNVNTKSNNNNNNNNNNNIPTPTSNHSNNHCVTPKLSYAARISSSSPSTTHKKQLRIRSGGPSSSDNRMSNDTHCNNNIGRSLHGNIAKDELLKIRMQQRDICYVAGLPKSICTRNILGSKKWFGQFGRIRDITITDNQNCIRTNWMCVHIKYFENISASKAVKVMNHKKLDDGRVLEANYGTQRYCEFFVNNKKCHKSNCPFRHSWCKLNEIVNFNNHHQIVAHHHHQQQQRLAIMNNNNNNSNNSNNSPPKLPQIQPHPHAQPQPQIQIQPQPQTRTRTPSPISTPITVQQQSNNMSNNIRPQPIVQKQPIIQQQSSNNNININMNNMNNNMNNNSVPSTSSTDVKQNDIYTDLPDEPVINLTSYDNNASHNSHSKSIDGDIHDNMNMNMNMNMNNIGLNLNINNNTDIDMIDDDNNNNIEREMNDLRERLQCVEQDNQQKHNEIIELKSSLKSRDSEIIKLQKISRRLVDAHNRMKAQNEKLLYANEELKRKVTEIQQQYQQMGGGMAGQMGGYYQIENYLDYTLWEWHDVYQWLMNIQNGKFKKYSEILLNNLKLENIDGQCIKCLATNDIHRIGITDFKDKQIILDEIHNLKSNLGLDNLIDDIINNAGNQNNINQNHNNSQASNALNSHKTMTNTNGHGHGDII